MDRIEYGKLIKSKFYNSLDPNTVFTNHGSYGIAPNVVLKKKRELQEEMEKCPDKWFRYTSFDLYKQNIKSLASYLKVNSDNILLCENATDSINSILKSIDFNIENPNQDVILATEHTYLAIKNAIDFTSRYRFKKPVEVIELKITFPIKEKKDLLDELDKTCDQIINYRKLNLKMAIFDHISSATALLYPIEEMNKIVRKWSKDCIILIDGAHALGQCKLDLEKYDCDFYVSNLHKWFLCTRACAFLYFKDKKKCIETLQPSYISHGYKMDMVYNFYQRGTSDKTSWFLVDECINFYENTLGGLDKISNYSNIILDQAVLMLEKDCKTIRLQIPKEFEAPFMRILKLPKLKNFYIENPKDAESVTIKLMKYIHETFGVVSCVMYFQNELYLRISCFVYNTLDDFVSLKNAILNLV